MNAEGRVSRSLATIIMGAFNLSENQFRNRRSGHSVPKKGCFDSELTKLAVDRKA